MEVKNIPNNNQFRINKIEKLATEILHEIKKYNDETLKIQRGFYMAEQLKDIGREKVVEILNNMYLSQQQIAFILGCSQPTISRCLARLQYVPGNSMDIDEAMDFGLYWEESDGEL
jgi:predicted XRE-type DNA-binding protein